MHENELKTLSRIIELDTQFLKQLGIMDYSLYVVVEHLKYPLAQ